MRIELIVGMALGGKGSSHSLQRRVQGRSILLRRQRGDIEVSLESVRSLTIIFNDKCNLQYIP